MKDMLQEFWIFGLKQARSCVFAGLFFLLLFVSHLIPLGSLPRYDFLFLASVLIQIILYLTKIETWDEIKTIVLFHLLGLLLELYKTSPQVGSWSYPEFSYAKILTVPLFSGFMYASVGSYISQAWRIMKLRLVGPISYKAFSVLGIVIYLNFFTNHFLPDIRWVLIPAVFLVCWNVWVEFTVTERVYRMPLALSFLLIAFFIWVAENISTYFGAWKYPDQLHAWTLVSWQKVSSWYLLVIISFILIAGLKHVKEQRKLPAE